MNQMIGLLKTPGRVAGVVFATALLASAQSVIARPGTVNYAEGRVTLDGRNVGAKALGQKEVAPGQVLETGAGKAEMLLTPGAFLRLGDNSAVKMVSPSLTNTQVELLQGEALVEVDQIQKENNLNVIDQGADIRLEKKGVYDINATQPMVAVYDGKAAVQVDDQDVHVGKGKELPLQANAKLKTQKFDRKQGDELYAWSKLRSGYLAQANMSSAQMIVADDPAWWYGTGWYWNPWFDTWAFVPGDGFFYSPFGYGFYSPAYWYYNAPYYYGGFGGGGRTWVRRPVVGGVRGLRGGTVGAGVIGRPAAPIGGSGVHFGGIRGGGVGMHAPAMGGGMRAPAMGGGGVRFGGRR